MNALKNSVRLTGFLGADPEIKSFGEGQNLAYVSMATNDRFKNKAGEWVEETQWHRLVMWGRQAQFAEEHLFKGIEISVEGKLINRTYTDKEGQTRYTTEIRVNEVLMFNRKSAE